MAGTIATTVDEYIAGFTPEVQEILRTVRATVRQSAPEAEERISYNMPTFTMTKVIVHFGAFKTHIGLFPPVREPALQDKIAPYRGEKGNLSFPLDKPVPYELISEIVKSRVNQARVKPKKNAAGVSASAAKRLEQSET